MSMLGSPALAEHIITNKHCASFGGDDYDFQFCNYEEGSTVLPFSIYLFLRMSHYC
jgi:hypothetical protein